jgi:hypothetical protein
MNTISKAAYEGDIVSRLRNWRGLHIAHSGRLYEEAADEIERLRNWSLEGRETVCPHVRGTVTQHCSLNFTLTAEEREAIARGIEELEGVLNIGCIDDAAAAATLRALLERLT